MTSRKIPESAVENLVSDLEGKANVANTVTTDTEQTISGSKRFTKPSAGMSIELVADTNQQTVPAKPTTRQLGLYRNATYTKGDGFTSWLQAVRGSDGWTGTELYTRRFLEGDSQEILNYIKALITSDGTPISYTKTPPAFCVGEEIVTAGWVRNACLLPGEIIIWSTSTPPAGYLICNGAAISRTTYANLFKVIGTTWGAGDGNTTFNLPNLYLLSDIKVKGYTKLGLTTYSAPNVPTSNLGMIYRSDEPAGASGPFVMFNQNVQNQGIGLTSDVNSTGLAYQKSTFPITFYIRY